MPGKRILHRLAYVYLNLIGFFGSLLPRRVMLRLAAAIGTFYWAVMRYDREMVRRNLSQVLGDPRAASRTTRRLYVRYAKYLVDYTRMDALREKHLRRLVRGFEGREHIEGAVSRGKGTLILTAHLGNWEMGGMFLSLLGFRLTVITAPDVQARLHDYRVQMREEQNIRVVTLDDTLASSLAVLKALQANELVALLGDRDLFGKGIPVSFFGKRIFFPIGPALLAYLSGAALVPTFVLMDEEDRYRCVAEPPIVLQRSGNRDEDLAENTRRIASVMEKFIRLHPDQWYTFYDYFRRHQAP